MDEERSKIQATLSKILGSHDRGASIFFLGSAANLKGSSYIPGLSDIDLLVVPRCGSLQEYKKWLEITSMLHEKLNQESSQLYDIFMLSDRIASLHFACLSTLAGPLLSNSALVDKKYSLTQLSKTYIDPRTRINIYRAMLRHMINKAKSQLPMADTRQGRKTVKFLRKLTKAVICSYAEPDEIELLEENLQSIGDLNSLSELVNRKLRHGPPFDDIFQTILNGERVSDWPAWMIAQEELIYWMDQVEKNLPSQNIKDTRLFGGIVKVILMLLIDLKTILGLQGEKREKRIGKFADETASAIVQLALSGVSSLVDFTTISTPARVNESHQILVNHLEDSRSNMECLAASVILLEYALERSIFERGK